MIRRVVRPWFRLAALLSLVGLLAGWTEASVPDVHEASAEAAQTHGGHDEHDAPANGAPDHGPQSPHLCHCLHAHAHALPEEADDAPRPDGPDPAYASAPRALASVAPEPHLRPPVA